MLQNAVRYASSYLKVSVTKTEREKAQIIFENDAFTLKEEDVPHLFERFYMSDVSRNGQGTKTGTYHQQAAGRVHGRKRGGAI